jgi:hypothetical protein
VSGSYGSLSVHLGANTRITCHAYPDTGPILGMYGADIALTVHGSKHKAVDATDVANAKALADAAAVYLAECQRIYHETHPNTENGTVTGSGAEVGCGDAADPGEGAAA